MFALNLLGEAIFVRNKNRGLKQGLLVMGVFFSALMVVYISNFQIQRPTGSFKARAASAPYGRPAENWSLVFADEFDINFLESNYWHTCFWWSSSSCAITSNGDEGLYNAEDVLATPNGYLRLRAQKREMVAWNNTTYHYTSGMVMSGGRKYEKPPSFKFKYGYVEARVKIPKGNGLGPDIWMLPVVCPVGPITSSNPCNYDSSKPEIDIMEMRSFNTYRVLMNYHWLKADGSPTSAPSFYLGSDDLSADYHIFAVDWQPTQIIWYIDGIERKRISDISILPTTEMYVILNLTVGGWVGSPDATTVFPSYYDIDYVRIWQKTQATPTPPVVTKAVEPTIAPGTCTCYLNRVSGNRCLSPGVARCYNSNLCQCIRAVPTQIYTTPTPRTGISL